MTALMLAFLAGSWEALPPLPRAISGQCAGVSNGALLVIGGSYFPVPLFEGGRKTWVDTIYVLTAGAHEWKTFRAPREIAYAACATAPSGVFVAGGGNTEQNYREAFRVMWNGSALVFTDLPPLPEPLANAAAVIAGRVMYVAGGQTTPTATEASRSVYTLDTQETSAGWKRLPDCPGKGRILPVLGTDGKSVFLATGAALTKAPEGMAKREYLRDALRFHKEKGWTRLPDVPNPAVAAPVFSRGSTVFILGGDDGENAFRIQELKDNHPGFIRRIVAWEPVTASWREVGVYTAGLVTTAAVEWNNRIVIAGGEDRPGHRSAEAIALPLDKLP